MAALVCCQEGDELDAAVSGSDLEGLAAQNVALKEALESCRAQIAAMADQARAARHCHHIFLQDSLLHQGNARP